MNTHITQDFLQYVDKNGLIAPTVGGGSLNGVLYTAISMIVMEDNKALPDELKQQFGDRLAKCFKEPGLLTRTPDLHPDQEGPDDLVGICAVAKLLGFPFAKDVLKYGLKHFFVYNNDGKLRGEDFLGRQIQLVTHMFYCAIGFCPPFFGVYWALAIWHSAFAKKENQDAFMLSWLLIRCLPKHNLLGRLAAKFWYKKMYAHFPRGFKDLNYLEGNNNHPICKYWIK